MEIGYRNCFPVGQIPLPGGSPDNNPWQEYKSSPVPQENPRLGNTAWLLSNKFFLDLFQKCSVQRLCSFLFVCFNRSRFFPLFFSLNCSRRGVTLVIFVDRDGQYWQSRLKLHQTSINVKGQSTADRLLIKYSCLISMKDQSGLSCCPALRHVCPSLFTFRRKKEPY